MHTGTRRALITGITGQDGSYLAEYLLEGGYEVYGMVRRSATPSTERIQHILGGVELVAGDLSDQCSLNHIMAVVKPHEVYNLAAQSYVPESWAAPEYTSDVTGLGVLRILEAIREHSPHSRFYQASSSEVFGKVVETPQRETTSFYPRSPYGVAKAYGHWITKNYRESYGMYACSGILFNHESPRRGFEFVTRKISFNVAEIYHGRRTPLELGNLSARRDWGFAGDYVQAMHRMLQRDSPDDYVIATGEAHTVREFVTLAFAAAGFQISWEGSGIDEVGVSKTGETLVKVNEAFFRPAEVDILLGDASKARSALGWYPETSFHGLVNQMVASDIVRLSNGVQ